MEKKQKTSSMISLVLMTIAAAMVIYCIATRTKGHSDATYFIAYIANLLALVCGIVYTLKGSTKTSAMWLKYFEGFVGLALLSAAARGASRSGNPTTAVLTTLSFGLLCILCYSENLGKKRSYCIGALLIVCKAIQMIMVFTSKIKLGMAVNLTSQLLMLVILVLLLTQKYRDKDARGTK